MKRNVKGQFISNADSQSVMLARNVLAQLAGMQYAGARDVDTVCGYIKNPSIENYQSMYDRRGIASVVVDAPAKTTWRKPPIISDGSEGKSDFMKALTALSTRLHLYEYLERVDRLAGIGRYGVLLIGTKEGELDQPMDTVIDAGQIIFLSSFGESSARVKTSVSDIHDPRYEQPETYSMDLGGDIVTGKKAETVHHSRVIHVAEGLLENEVFGEPRMKKVYNRLQDLDKIIGSSAEGYWQAAAKAYAVSLKEGFTPADGALENAKVEFQSLIHGLQRIAAVEGFDIQELKGAIVDPTAAFDVVISIISGKTGIPKRILLGSERGELASSQDQENWLGRVAERQKQFAEPKILRPVIDAFITYHALPAPSGGSYTVEWPALFYLSDIELAKVHSLNANAIRNIVGKDGDPLTYVTMGELREMLGLPAEKPQEAVNGQ